MKSQFLFENKTVVVQCKRDSDLKPGSPIFSIRFYSCNNRAPWAGLGEAGWHKKPSGLYCTPGATNACDLPARSKPVKAAVLRKHWETTNPHTSSELSVCKFQRLINTWTETKRETKREGTTLSCLTTIPYFIHICKTIYLRVK